MVYKIKTSETWEVHYDEKTWFVTIENELETGETYYSLIDDEKVEVEDGDLFNEIVDYLEQQTGTSLDDWDDDYDDDVDAWDESYI